MTIKSALSVFALSAGLIAAPAFAQDMMIGTQTVAETDAAAVTARCEDLKLADETQSLASGSESAESDEDNETSVAGDADIEEVPATDSETALSVDLDIITLEECEAGGWFDM